jgi:PQQ-like domain
MSSPRVDRVSIVTMALALTMVSPVGAWQAHLGRTFGEDNADIVRVDGRHDVVALGRTGVSGDCGTLTAASFSPRGALRWQHRLERDCFRPDALLIDVADDTYVKGTLWPDEDSTSDQVLRKLDGRRGTVLWTYTLAQPDRESNGGFSVEGFDDDGNVVLRLDEVVGYDPDVGAVLEHFRVLLDGATGAERSRVAIPPRAAPFTPLRYLGGGVVQSRYADDSIRWESTVAGFEDGRSLVPILEADPAGDVYIGGSSVSAAGARDFALVKMAGADGRELWRQTIPFGFARVLAFTPQGDPIVAGAARTDGSQFQFTVMRLRKTSGRRRWMTVLDGLGGSGATIALDRRGGWVAVGGSAIPPVLDPTDPFFDDSWFTVARLSGRTGHTRGVLRYDPPH